MRKIVVKLSADISDAIWLSPRLQEQKRELGYGSFDEFIQVVYDVEYEGLDEYRATEHNLNWLLMHV